MRLRRAKAAQDTPRLPKDVPKTSPKLDFGGLGKPKNEDLLMVILSISQSKHLSIQVGTAECAERLNPPHPLGWLACGIFLYFSCTRWVLALPGTLRIPPFSFKSLHRKWLRTFFSIFWPSKKCFKICFEKITQKVRKLRFSASQNPSKILPKRLRNRCSNKHAIFQRLLLEFCLFRYPRIS